MNWAKTRALMAERFSPDDLANSDKRMAEHFTKGTFLYTPGILCYLSARLDMPS